MKKWIFVLIAVLISYSFGQDVVINEIMSLNTLTITDEDDDFSDWLELYNRSAIPVNLNRFGLSDDSSDHLKWQFPQYRDSVLYFPLLEYNPIGEILIYYDATIFYKQHRLYY